LKFYQHLDQKPPSVQIDIDLGVPLARGLGSSATAIVGGLVGANALAGSPLNQTEVMELAIALEGHPDNVGSGIIRGMSSRLLLMKATNGRFVIFLGIKI
jgi:homoserine kinase